MADYSQTTFFAPKDALITGDSNKLIRGSEVDPELLAISTAIATKYDSSDLSSNAQATAGTDNTTLMTPLRVSEAIGALGGGNPLVVGTGATASDAEIIINSGNTVLADESTIQFQHNSGPAFFIRNVVNATSTGYDTMFRGAADTSTIMEFKDVLGNYEVYINEDTHIIGDVEIGDGTVGGQTLTLRDGALNIRDEFNHPTLDGFRFALDGQLSGTAARLNIAPALSNTDNTFIKLRTREDRSGGIDHDWEFDNVGDLSVPGYIVIDNTEGLSSKGAGLELRNFDWSSENDGSWIQYATGQTTGSSSTLVFYPSDKDGNTFIGEFQLTVGNPAGTTYTWVFDRNGNLSRNGTNMTFP